MSASLRDLNQCCFTLKDHVFIVINKWIVQLFFKNRNDCHSTVELRTIIRARACRHLPVQNVWLRFQIYNVYRSTFIRTYAWNRSLHCVATLLGPIWRSRLWCLLAGGDRVSLSPCSKCGDSAYTTFQVIVIGITNCW